MGEEEGGEEHADADFGYLGCGCWCEEFEAGGYGAIADDEEDGEGGLDCGEEGGDESCGWVRHVDDLEGELLNWWSFGLWL